jgi:hypothetical protein
MAPKRAAGLIPIANSTALVTVNPAAPSQIDLLGHLRGPRYMFKGYLYRTLRQPVFSDLYNAYDHRHLRHFR